MTPVIVLTTVSGDFAAEPFAEGIVERRLAACVNIIARARSVYRWREKIEHDDEQLLIIKTTEERLAELRAHLFAMHPYEVPELIVVQIDAIEGPYREWLIESTDRR